MDELRDSDVKNAILEKLKCILNDDDISIYEKESLAREVMKAICEASQ